MTGSLPAQAAHYLISTLIGLYIIAVALRFLLQLVRADFYNPVSQLLVKITTPALLPLRRLLLNFARIDGASLVLMLLLQILEIGLAHLLLDRPLPSLPGLLVLAVAELVRLFIYMYIVIIFIQALSSWIHPGAYNPITVLLYKLSEPLLRPVRRHVPPVAGVDFSALIVLIALPLLFYLLVEPLVILSRSL